MRKLFKLVVVFLLSHNAMAQGTVNFANWVRSHDGNVNAPFFNYQGKPIEGLGYVAQLYWGTDATSLAPVQNGSAFFGKSGYFIGNAVTLPTDTPGGPAWVQVRAWEFSPGRSYETAKEVGVWTGVSSILYLPKTGNPTINPPDSPALMVGLTFVAVPEPSTYALLLVGAGALFLECKRSKRCFVSQSRWYQCSCGIKIGTGGSSQLSGTVAKIWQSQPPVSQPSAWLTTRWGPLGDEPNVPYACEPDPAAAQCCLNALESWSSHQGREW
jgi:hypothetical protein